MNRRAFGQMLAGLVRLAGFGAVGPVMAQRDFRLFTIGLTVNLPGLWIYRVALAWLAWDLTHSGAWLGLIVAADALPALLLAPIGGAFADRLDRRKLTLATQVVQLILSAILIGLTIAGRIDIIALLILTFLRGVNLSFWQPVRLTLVPSLVPREHLGTAIAVNATIFNTSFFIGPALAGPLIIFGGAGLAFAVDFVSTLFFMFALLAMRFGKTKTSGVRRGVFAEIGEGFVFAARDPGIRMLVLLGAVISLGARPVGELLAGFADLLFNGGAGTLSALTAAMGLGALVGAVWVIRSGDRGQNTARLISVGFGASIAVLVFLLAGSFAVALIALSVAGFGFSVVGIVSQTLMQRTVPDHMRGRLLSIHGMIMRGGPGIGALLMGLASGGIGLRLPVVAGAVITMAACVFAWTRRRQLATDLAHGPAAVARPPSPSCATGSPR